MIQSKNKLKSKVYFVVYKISTEYSHMNIHPRKSVTRMQQINTYTNHNTNKNKIPHSEDIFM